MGSLNTFFTWRGSHHGKRTAQNVGAQSALILHAERAKWQAVYPHTPLPQELWTPAEHEHARLAGIRPWSRGGWWTALALTALGACTIPLSAVTALLMLPVLIVMIPPLKSRNPYYDRGQAVDPTPPTLPIATVPDPVREYELASYGRHAR